MSRTYEQLEPVISALDERIKTGLSAFPTDTAEGSIVSFPDGADDLPLKSLVVNIDPVQDLHGQSNPYPAGGGKNKIKYPYTYGNSCTINGVTFTVDSQGVITANGTATANAEFIIMNGTGQNLPAGSWTIGCLPSGGGNSSFVFNFYGKDSNDTLLFDYRTDTFKTVTATADISQLYIGLRIIGGYTCNNLQVHPQFESGSTATAYAPYENICPISGWTGMDVNANGTVIPISWQTEAGTVYGGSLDVLSGVLTVDRVYEEFDLSQYSYSTTNGFDGWTIPISNTTTGASNSAGNISNIANYAYASSTHGTNHYYAGANAVVLYLTEGSARDKTAQFVYPLATPITIQLTPHEVKSLYGQNNIFADTGDCTVEYRADTKLYIERLTEPDADMIADSNIVSGQYFMVGNSLYLATSNIASGGQVIVGTNCTQKSLSEALNEINS